MKTILITSQKGGSGKTTLAANLSVAAHQAGKRTIMINLDPQKSLRQWWEAREGDGPTMGDQDISPEALRSVLPGLAEHFDICVIDTPPTAHEWLANVIASVDLALVPVRPSAYDVRAAAPTVEIIRKAKTDFAFVLNQTPRAKITDAVARGIGRHGRLAPVNVGFRVAYSETAETGQGVMEYTDPRAADEIRELWAYVEEVLTNG